jgi:hypothetical protein
MWHLTPEYVKKIHTAWTEYSCWLTLIQNCMLHSKLNSYTNLKSTNSIHDTHRHTHMHAHTLIHIKFHHFMKGVQVILLLIPSLSCNVNSSCQSQEMNIACVLLTAKVSVVSGGFILFSFKAFQSMPWKYGCCLMALTWPWDPNRWDGSFFNSCK